MAATWAQAQNPQDTPRDIPATLDAVIVTANKRVENVQEVPKQIMVVTPEALTRSGVTTMRELGNAIPSISGASSGDERTPAPPIRGVASFAYSIGVQSQTGVVVDDVPQPSFSSLFKELADVERVEVLAGPQSTLSGRNASGGLINIVTRAPSMDLFSGEAFMEHTSDRQQRFSAFMTGPISTTLAFSVSAFFNEWDGHYRSLVETDGSRPLHLGGWETRGVRGKLRWQPNARLDSTLTLYTMDNTTLRPAAIPMGAFFYADPAAVLGLDTLARSMSTLYPGLEIKRYNTWVGTPQHSIHDSHDRGGSLKLEYELDHGATLTSISALTKASMPRHDNFNFFGSSSLDGFNLFNPDDLHAHTNYDTESKSQEFRLTSPEGKVFDYVLGLSWNDLDTFFPYQRLLVFPVNWLRRFDMQSGAFFGRGTWHVGERDALTAGLRYQRDKMGYSWAFLPLQADATIADNYVTGNSHYDFVSGELSWRRELAEQVNGYITIARAQSGENYDMEDNNGAASVGGLQPLDSQKVTNFEVGLKGQWLDRRLTANLNAFLAKYTNYQIQTIETTGANQAPVIKIFAIGKVETRGVEFETRLRASENLNLALAGAWMDAKIKDFPNAQCYERQSAALGCNPNTGFQDNLAGSPMPSAPKFRLNGAVSYFVPLDQRPFDLELGASYRWQSELWFDFRGNPNLYQDDYGILNLSVAVHDRDGRYSLSVFVNNVLDKHFYVQMADDPRWTAPAYNGAFARDSFRYSGLSLRVNF